MCIPYIEFQRAYWQEMVENQPTFHTKLLLHSTNRITGCILYAVEPLAQYNSVFRPENAPNIFDVLCVAYVLMASIVCTDIRCSNRQLDPSNLAYHDLESNKKIYLHTAVLYMCDIVIIIIIIVIFIVIIVITIIIITISFSHSCRYHNNCHNCSIVHVHFCYHSFISLRTIDISINLFS